MKYRETVFDVNRNRTAKYGCATRAQITSGRKSRPENCRFIPVATQAVG